MLKKLNSSTIKFKLDFKFFIEIFSFGITISAEKLTSEIDTDLVQNEM